MDSRRQRMIDDLFLDFKGRRKAIINALTIDVDKFFQECDPERDNLCLFGFPNERWEVNLPAEEVPPEYPEPTLGINFARDGMPKRDWLSLVAVHSDVWLLAVASFVGTKFGFTKVERKCLFNMINELPTVFEVVTDAARNQSMKKSPVSNHSSNKSTLSTEAQTSESNKQTKQEALKDEDRGFEDEDEEEPGDTLCGACGQNYAAYEFWICCDVCEKWFHGNCVKITPARAEHIKQYKCPSCSNKRM